LEICTGEEKPSLESLYKKKKEEERRERIRGNPFDLKGALPGKKMENGRIAWY